MSDDWLLWEDPKAMLGRVAGRDSRLTVLPDGVDDRRLRLFACAAIRRRHDHCHWWSADDWETLRLVEIYTDHPPDRFAAWKELALRSRNVRNTGVCAERALEAAHHAIAWPGIETALYREWRVLCAHIIRDLFWNPWQPRLFVDGHTIMRQELDGTVGVDRGFPNCPPAIGLLARPAYRDRLPDGRIDRMPLCMLADLLEEHGCSSDAVLTHLRHPGPHYRGCHVLDLLCDIARPDHA